MPMSIFRILFSMFDTFSQAQFFVTAFFMFDSDIESTVLIRKTSKHDLIDRYWIDG